jgi:acetolactate synthase I/II/III large subunit
MKVYDVLAKAFAAEGVETVFALMGDGNMAFLCSLAEREGVTLVGVRHENMGTGMADGYVRGGREVGVCSVTYSPGLTQIPTALMVAGRHRTPIVVFAGEAPLSDRYPGSAHMMNQRALIEAAEAGWQSLRSPETAAEDVAQAFYRARTERRPIVLCAPTDIQYSKAPGKPELTPSSGLLARPEPAPAPANDISRAADLLAGSQRPLILVGAGAGAAAKDAVERLADLAGATLVTTLAAKGAVAGNPRYVGLAGSFADARAARHLEAADCVLAVGSSLDAYVTKRGTLFSGARVIHVDRDPGVLVAGTRAAEIRLVGDALLTLGALHAELDRKGFAQERGLPENFDFARQDLEAYHPEPEPGTLDPRRLMLALGDLLPDDCSIVVGAGHFSAFPLSYLPERRSHTYIPVFDFGSIGQGLPVAIGACFAQPEQRVIAFEGDASLMMNIQELETIARHRLPLLLLAMNDGALGAEFHRLAGMGFDPGQAAYEPPAFARIGEAFGIPSSTLRDPSEAAGAVGAFLSEGGPRLVDVRTSRRVVGRYYRAANQG